MFTKRILKEERVRKIAGGFSPFSQNSTSRKNQNSVVINMVYQINLMFFALPTLICAMGIAQSVHMLLNWQREQVESGSPREAARRVMEKIGTPALLCALTMAAGLIGMSNSQLKVMREFGLYSSLGVILTFVVALLVMTSLAARTKGKANKKPKWHIISGWNASSSAFSNWR